MERKNRAVNLLLVGSLVTPVALGAQDCRHGPSQAAPSEAGASYGWPEQVARSAVVNALRKAGFRVQRVSPTDTIILTESRFDWGESPDRRHWLEHPHPGVILMARVQPEGDSSRVILQARAVCAVPPTDPPHDHGTPEEAAQLLATLDVGTALMGEYQEWRRSHPKPMSRAAETAVVPPELLSCQRPSPADSALPRGVSGRVFVQGVVDTTGRFEGGRVSLFSSDYPELNAFALKVAVSCRFRPGMSEGLPIRVLVRIPIDIGR
jgi:TonB family protein